jgi:hypothetical protein
MKYKDLKEYLNSLNKNQLDQDVIVVEKTDYSPIITNIDSAFIVEDGDTLSNEGLLDKVVLYIPRLNK